MRTRAVLDQVISHALATGCFERVSGHEPKQKNQASNGITCAVWAQLLAPVGEGSGLSVSSARLELTVRVYTNMLAEPQDDIDPRVLDAVDTLVAAYHADFDLGGEARFVDVFGAYGPGLEARAGYLNQSGVLYRVVDVRLPIIIDDCWPQAA